MLEVEQQNQRNGNAAKKTLFVCRNNIARSQWAAGVYNSFRPGEASSAGTDVPGRGNYVAGWDDPARDRLVGVAAAEGIEIAQNERTPLDEEALREVGRVILLDFDALTELETRIGRQLNLPGREIWRVPDPHHMSMEESFQVFNIVKAKVGELATRVSLVGGDGLGSEVYMPTRA